MKVQKIVVNGSAFLGKLEEVDGGFIMTGVPMTSDFKSTCAEYLEKKNQSQLVPTTLTGPGVNFSATDFNDFEITEMKCQKVMMKQARKMAAAGNENAVFRSLLGK